MTATIETVSAAEERISVASNWKLVWWRFRKHKLALFSAGLLVVLYAIVLCPDFFSTQDPERTDARQAFIPIQGIHFFDGRWQPRQIDGQSPNQRFATRFRGRLQPFSLQPREHKVIDWIPRPVALRDSRFDGAYRSLKGPVLPVDCALGDPAFESRLLLLRQAAI